MTSKGHHIQFNEEISFCVAFLGTLIIDGTLLPSGFILPHFFLHFPCSPKLNVQQFPKDTPHVYMLASFPLI